MNNQEDNLLLRLHKLAWRQDENFHTEALVHLLRYLLKYESAVAVQFLKKITCERLDLVLQDKVPVNINTRVKTPKGYYPDIEIKTTDCLIYIEVKVGFEPSDRQIENYREALAESNFKKTGLILLTKFPVAKQIKDKSDGAIRWYQIAGWLEGELDHKTIQQPSSIYITEQFLEFLQGKGLTVSHINEALIPGIQSLLNLLIMLDKALVLTKASSIISDSQWDWIGYHFKFDSQEYWIGLRFDRPNILFVEIDEIDPMIYKQLDLGYVYYWEEYEYWCWIHELDLSSEETKFFLLSKSDQLQCIEQFLKKSFDAVRQIPTY